MPRIYWNKNCVFLKTFYMIGEINDFSINTCRYYQVLLNFSEIVFVKPKGQKQDQKRLLFGPWKSLSWDIALQNISPILPKKASRYVGPRNFLRTFINKGQHFDLQETCFVEIYADFFWAFIYYLYESFRFAQATLVSNKWCNSFSWCQNAFK